MRRTHRLLGSLVALATLTGTVGTVADAHGSRDDLVITTARAPVAPDGTTAGAMTDFVVTFRDIDPQVEGIGLRADGTIRVTLPPEFVNTGAPVLPTGPGCGPPVVSGCSTAVILQGWPQSPVLPFPDLTWDAATNTLELTARTDWLPAGADSPGPKQVHLITLGFRNPDRPGNYPIRVEIQPDPDDPETLVGEGHVQILRRSRPSANPNSQANGAPPPPFPNTLFQNVAAGDDSLTMATYLWDRDGQPVIGADVDMLNHRLGLLRDADDHPIGTVRVTAPRGSRDHALVSGGPSTLINAFVTGVPVGRWTAVLETDSAVAGVHRVEIQLFGGNRLDYEIETH